MTVYLDLVFLINFFFDSILLFSVALILKRQTNLKRILLGSVFGTISISCLFIRLSSISLFLIKFLIALIMVIITFNYKDIRYTFKNIFYLYMVSIILGGFLYLLNIEFNYKHDGIIFYNKGLKANFYLFLLTSPLIIYLYIKQIKDIKNNYSNYYKLDIYLNDGKVISTTSFLDTGNNLFDPYFNRPIILIDNNLIKDDYNYKDILLVPYDTIDSHGILKCLKVNYIYILGIGIRRNVLIGISNKKIMIDGVDSILNRRILEEEIWKKYYMLFKRY